MYTQNIYTQITTYTGIKLQKINTWALNRQPLKYC